MKWKFALLGAVLAMATGLTSAAVAGSNDYNFEPVPAEVKKGNGVTITVRLVHTPSGKAVPDAVIYASRIDMSPEGMATMAAPLSPVAGGEPGSYSFKTDLVMAGQWLLSLSARVQGEPEVVQGKITFKAAN
jgi:hypothetical protein